jgi:ubiquinol-cytochrome c reductase cytochrome c1 subunit
MKLMKKLIAALAFVPALVFANEGGFPLDHAPDRTNDLPALQNGAKLFVNYCLNCHAAAFMRYNRLRDIGLTEDQIKANLLFATDKVGDTMKVSMPAKEAKDWFGAVPPDLSVISRSRGADWLYTYLRTFYKDDTRPTGWNNLVFNNVGMPHVLWELQGIRAAKFEERKDPHEEGKTVHEFAGFETVKAGKMTEQEFDSNVADLVSYLEWMGEPAQHFRKRLGVIVLLYLAFFSLLAWRLNESYWKEVK